MNEHANKRIGAVQRYSLPASAPKTRQLISDAGKVAQTLCQCPRTDCSGVKMTGDAAELIHAFTATQNPRIYRTSLKSVTLQCNRCKLQWTMTWHMLLKSTRATWQAEVDETEAKAKAIRDLRDPGPDDRADEFAREMAESRVIAKDGMIECLTRVTDITGKT